MNLLILSMAAILYSKKTAVNFDQKSSARFAKDLEKNTPKLVA